MPLECIFFFSSRRRHTRCSRDWSSDVCSSDLFLRAGAEDEAGAQEVAAPQLVDPDRFCHWSCTYLSWNSGDANARNQRAWSSAAALSRLAVCALSTVSRWAGAPAPGGACRSWLSTAPTKLTRATTLLDEIQASLLGQPPTSGGSNSTWPKLGADWTASRDRPLAP